jgi:hypothetical protein
MPTTEELLGELVETAREQLRWQRASVLPEVRKTIERTLTSTQLRRAYEMCDGETQGSDIAAAVGTSPQSISAWTSVGVTSASRMRLRQAHQAPS